MKKLSIPILELSNINKKTRKALIERLNQSDDVTGEKNAFGVVFDSPVLSKNRTISECASSPIVKRGLARSMAVVLVQKEAKAFGLEEYIDNTIGSLPKNIAARAEVFTAYMCSHDLIAINEPFSTLNEDERKTETELLINLKNSTKLSLLIFTKDIDTALQFGDYIMVVNDKTESTGIIACENLRDMRQRWHPRLLKKTISSLSHAAVTVRSMRL